MYYVGITQETTFNILAMEFGPLCVCYRRREWTIFARCILFAYYGRRDWAYKKLLLLWQLHWVKFEPKMCLVIVTVFWKGHGGQISKLFHAKKWPLIGWLCRLTNQRPICHFHIFLKRFTGKFHYILNLITFWKKIKHCVFLVYKVNLTLKLHLGCGEDAAQCLIWLEFR